MRARSWLALSALLVGGCFDEGGDDAAQAKTIETLVQGLIAFGDIHSNIETDPGAAGTALLEFMKWPVAADALVSPPFGGETEVMNTSPRLAPALPVPDCLSQLDEPSCDTYVTTDTCEAGDFTFRGAMARRCADCDNPRGLCAYAWVLPDLTFTSSAFTLSLKTKGSWVGTTGQVTPNLSARYDLNITGGGRYGNLSACACTTFTVVDSPTESGKPRKLVNSSFIVRLIDEAQIVDDRCALVEFDGNGNPSVSGDCSCKNGHVCEQPTGQYDYIESCGNGTCDSNETYETCPVDCAVTAPECGDGKCELGESAITCAEDCLVLP